jgi:8-oxo-dGTP pyrophosphatase MutT (NUDIX family)
VGRTEYLNDPAAPKPNSLVPAAGILASDAAGRVLLQRRRDTSQWAIPMGKQELGETVARCAVRETREETCITAEVTGILGIYSDPGHIVAYTDGEVRQEYEVILLGRPVSGQPTVNDEASDVGWFTPAELDPVAATPRLARRHPPARRLRTAPADQRVWGPIIRLVLGAAQPRLQDIEAGAEFLVTDLDGGVADG